MAPVDLTALPQVVIVPGIARWLGRDLAEPVEPLESYEDFLDRISREAET